MKQAWEPSPRRPHRRPTPDRPEVKLLAAEEWQEVPFNASSVGLTRDEAEALERTAAYAGAKALFRWSRSGVMVQNWIGVVRAGSVRLAVLPKGWFELGDFERRNYQRNLIQLAAEATRTKFVATGMGDVTLDWSMSAQIFRLFLARVTRAQRRRVIRTYQVRRERSPSMRGTLAFPRQIFVRLSNPAMFATQYSELSADNPFNRTLLRACRVIARSGHEELRRRAINVAASLQIPAPDPDFTLDLQRAKRMRLDPVHVETLAMAELILLRLGSRGLFVGSAALGAELVASDRLWEYGVTELIIRTALGHTAHPPGEFALVRELGPGPHRLLRVIPDVLGPSLKAVVDLKWKFVNVSFAIDVGDLHQILTYARHFEASRAVLIFPTLSNVSQALQYRTVRDPGQSVRIAFVPVADSYRALVAAVADAI